MRRPLWRCQAGVWGVVSWRWCVLLRGYSDAGSGNGLLCLSVMRDDDGKSALQDHTLEFPNAHLFEYLI